MTLQVAGFVVAMGCFVAFVVAVERCREVQMDALLDEDEIDWSPPTTYDPWYERMVRDARGFPRPALVNYGAIYRRSSN